MIAFSIMEEREDLKLNDLHSFRDTFNDSAKGEDGDILECGEPFGSMGPRRRNNIRSLKHFHEDIRVPIIFPGLALIRLCERRALSPRAIRVHKGQTVNI